MRCQLGFWQLILLQSLDYIDQILISPPCMSLTTNSTTQTQKTMDFRQKFKTERCRYWYERGFCPFGQCCAFAHQQGELREKSRANDNYKTKACVNFKTHGYCKYGDRCQFLHLSEAPEIYARTVPTAKPISDTCSQNQSLNSSDAKEQRHQKQLSILQGFGLDLLGIKKVMRSNNWRSFLMSGEDPYEQEAFRLLDIEKEFPDYDFKRKPRLGSM